MTRTTRLLVPLSLGACSLARSSSPVARIRARRPRRRARHRRAQRDPALASGARRDSPVQGSPLDADSDAEPGPCAGSHRSPSSHRPNTPERRHRQECLPRPSRRNHLQGRALHRRPRRRSSRARHDATTGASSAQLSTAVRIRNTAARRAAWIRRAAATSSIPADAGVSDSAVQLPPVPTQASRWIRTWNHPAQGLARDRCGPLDVRTARRADHSTCGPLDVRTTRRADHSTWESSRSVTRSAAASDTMRSALATRCDQQMSSRTKQRHRVPGQAAHSTVRRRRTPRTSQRCGTTLAPREYMMSSGIRAARIAAITAGTIAGLAACSRPRCSHLRSVRCSASRRRPVRAIQRCDPRSRRG